MPRHLVTVLLALAGLGLAIWLVPGERATVERILSDFPEADASSQRLRPWVVGGLCFLPAIAAALYGRGDILSRYVCRQFLVNLAITFGALTVIWLLVDLQDNLEDMQRSGHALDIARRLYAARIPEIVVMLLPFSLLLSLLFTLGRLSGSREIVAMLQSGRGIFSITSPFLVTGLLSALLCAALNYQWAPRATAEEERILNEARGRDESAAEFVKFRNPRVRRLWLVGFFPPDYQTGAPLRDLRVIEENPDGTLRRILTAATARWSPADKTWSFHDPAILQIRPGEEPLFEPGLSDPHVVDGWLETPAEIIQPGLPAGQLGIPGLRSWLQSHPPGSLEPRELHLTQWHARWAQPFNCLVLVLLATPLGVVFTRRGASGGVAVAVFLCAGLMFLTNICLNLGEAGHLPPTLAAWLPNLVFGGLSLYLFRRRIAGRPIYQVLRRLVPNAG